MRMSSRQESEVRSKGLGMDALSLLGRMETIRTIPSDEPVATMSSDRGTIVSIEWGCL